MTTTATSNIRFGGSGFGPDYFPIKARRKVAGGDEDDNAPSGSKDSFLRGRREDVEVFLFTVKDPIRGALKQLMLLLQDVMDVAKKQEEIEPEPPPIVSGPMGYTNLRAIRPVAFIPTKSIFRPVLR